MFLEHNQHIFCYNLSIMNIITDSSWNKVLKTEFEKEYFINLTETIRKLYQGSEPVFPQSADIFKAFELSPFDSVKVVIIGQDPYHGTGQAHGLSFSVPDGMRIPPSLKNMYKEIQDDIGTSVPESGNLERWAKQGILLLNATLTVLEGKPTSHQGLGWEQFTDTVIQTISDKKEYVVFLLWGKYAQDKEKLIDSSKHLILKAPHPSPFSAHSGFFGCKHFSKANAYLEQHAQKPVAW